MLKWYPPLLLQRIKAEVIAEDFLHVRMRAKRSLLNRNLNGTMFGGSIYAAADPIFPLMYWQALARRGLDLQTWLMASKVQYRKPVASSLWFDFRLREEDLAEATAALAERGKAVRTHMVQAVDAEGEVCAELELVSYLRLLRQGEQEVAGF